MLGIIIGTVNGLTRPGPLPSRTWAWVSIVSKPPTPEPMITPMHALGRFSKPSSVVAQMPEDKAKEEDYELLRGVVESFRVFDY